MSKPTPRCIPLRGRVTFIEMTPQLHDAMSEHEKTTIRQVRAAAAAYKARSC